MNKTSNGLFKFTLLKILQDDFLFYIICRPLLNNFTLRSEIGKRKPITGFTFKINNKKTLFVVVFNGIEN